MFISLLLIAILVGVYGGLLTFNLFGTSISSDRRGVLALGVLFIFTGTCHFLFIRGMTQMIPPAIPLKEVIIVVSGVFEVALGLVFMTGYRTRLAGYVAIGFLAAVFPLNVYSALSRIDFGGHQVGPAYLMLRTPVQVALIIWVWFFCLRRR